MIKTISEILLLLIITQPICLYPQPVGAQEDQGASYQLIFFEYCQNPKNWSVLEDSNPSGGIITDGTGRGYRQVGKDRYEIKVFQGAGYEEIWSWVPIRFEDSFFEYSYTYYQCPTLTPVEAKNELGMKPNCPWEINVKGEIIIEAPARIRFYIEGRPQTVRPTAYKVNRTVTVQKL